MARQFRETWKRHMGTLRILSFVKGGRGSCVAHIQETHICSWTMQDARLSNQIFGMYRGQLLPRWIEMARDSFRQYYGLAMVVL